MERPVVTISDGKLRGIVLKNVLGNDYVAFKGIPYAQPPIGPLRFKEPQPKEKWSDIRDASKHGGDISMQYQTAGPKPWSVIGSEDCLYLNVYIKSIGYKRPVMFYIHGGSFVEGSANDNIYGEDYFVTADIVLVSVNYRLGPMGFLSVGHEVASGNQGLRDIILGLKWVRKNIESFGGDPDNVTIFGNSSGSATVHLLTLIPMAKGLFHRAILQSGTIFFMKSLLMGREFKNGHRIASLLGMESNDPEEVINFLRSTPAKKLVGLEGHLLSHWEKVIKLQEEYGPIFDGPYCKDPVIPVPIRELLKNNANVPIIVGYTKDEALLFFAGHFDNVDNFKFHDDNFEDILRNNLMLKESSLFPEIMAGFRKFYLKDKPIDKDNVRNMMNLFTFFFINMNRKLIDLRNEHANAPTYVYNFSYMGNEPTFYQYDIGPQPLKGVAHADELSYMFNISYMKEDGKYAKYPQEGTKDRLVMERLIKMWSNFAATGNPTPEIDDELITTVWKPVTKENLYHLKIDEDLTLFDDKDTEDWKFYNKFSKYYLEL